VNREAIDHIFPKQSSVEQFLSDRLNIARRQVERKKMIINAEKQQGQIVWAKISKKSKLWAGM